jgi:2-iminobutanoate/2-iminopropanoate deaminase
MKDLPTASGGAATTNRPVPITRVSAEQALNEAYDYELPSSFSRGIRVELPCVSMVFISGTASVDEKGETLHVGDFAAQCRRTFHNITELLRAEGATWQHIIRTSCYIKDINRDYDEFNRVRTEFFNEIGLDPLPASTGIQAGICRDELLVEIEAIAMIRRDGPTCSWPDDA